MFAVSHMILPPVASVEGRRDLKVKLHFNRVNMQRGKQEVWSAHTSKSCNPSREVRIMHHGRTVARTVFQPDKPQNPRAWIEADGFVTNRNGITYIEVV